MGAAQFDLDAMLLAQRIEAAEAALLLVDPALAPDSILAASATEAGQSRSGCAGLLGQAAARLDQARARADVLPHGLLRARAALSEAICEATILGEVW